MKYLIDSYTGYMVNGGMLGKGSEVVNWFFVEFPFFFLRLNAMIFLLTENVMNQSAYFVGKQQEAYNYSLNILNGFGGTGILKGSLLALGILLSAYYLLYSFFSNKHNFMKRLLHYFAVFALFIVWFGQVTVTNPDTKQKETHSGAIFLVDSIGDITSDIQNKFTASVDFSGDTSTETIDGKKKVYQSPMFDATVLQTFNFVNSGSMDGEMANGEKLDYDKLLMKPGLSKKEQKTFINERKGYIEGLENENPYFRQNTSRTMVKSFAIWTGMSNLFILSIPVLYINLMLSFIQLIVTLLILVFPVVLLASFFPRCQMVLFKFFQGLIGALFTPIVFGIFLSVLFWINKLIDGAFFGLEKKISGSLLELISGGMVHLVVMFVAVVVKIFVLRKIWKSRYAILAYFSNGQVEQPVFEQKVEQVADHAKERSKDVVVGGAIMAAGAYTGNMAMVANGAGNILPNQDRAIQMAHEHFFDDNGAFTGLKSGLQSMFNRQPTEEQTADEPNSEREAETLDHSLVDSEDGEQVDTEVTPLDDSMVDVEEVADRDSGESLAEFNLGLEDLDVTLEPVEEFGEEPPVMPEEALRDDHVTVSNLDELEMAREERAFFDGGNEQELITQGGIDSTNNIYPFVQAEEYLMNLEETESQFFGTNDYDISNQNEEWA